MTTLDFCRRFGACAESKEFAENTPSLRVAWETAPAEFMVWGATREGVLSERELRLFACWCCRQVWRLLTDPRSRYAVEVAEKFARGNTTEKDLAAAWAAALEVARDTAAAAAWAAARAAALEVARDTAAAAAWAAARAAALAAARAAALEVARDCAWAAALEAQAAYLRENCHPNFAAFK